jgi:lysophospholipase L1-like esterase
VKVLAAEVQWRVEAGFAPFAYLADPDAASKLWLPKKYNGEVESFGQWYAALHKGGHLAASPYREWLHSTPEAQLPWNSDGTHQTDYISPKGVTIRASISDTQGMCTWKLLRDGLPVADSITTGECADEIEMRNVRLSGDILLVSTPNGAKQTPITVRQLIIVGLGDSYASGEGNPDVPTQWKTAQAPIDSFEWLNPGSSRTLVERGAKWLHDSCHRSFFSYQTFTALRLAAENPHRLVTFLHYACSGAEIFDGLVAPQYRPPGMLRSCRERVRQHGTKRMNRDEEGCFLPRSQIASMMTDLCAETGGAAPATEIREQIQSRIRRSGSLDRLENFRRGRGIDAVTCSTPRQPDLVLLSIGGNDAGFAQLVAWAIVPHRARASLLPGNQAIFAWIRSDSVVCPALGRSEGERCKSLDYDLVRQLLARFRVLRDVLEGVLPGVQSRVVLNSYPVAVTDHSASNPRRCFDEAGCNPLNGWDGARHILSSQVGFLPGAARCDRSDRGWHFNIRQSEVDALVFKKTSAGQATLPMLREKLEHVAGEFNFNFAHLTGAALDGHGFCRLDTGDMPIALPSRAPRLWTCRSNLRNAPSLEISGNPACWEAYRPAGRFIRTINDSLMTMTSDRKDGLAGAFHPTAQGHAAIAEAAWGTVEMVVRDERSVAR